jgi:hypothetical protein
MKMFLSDKLYKNAKNKKTEIPALFFMIKGEKNIIDCPRIKVRNNSFYKTNYFVNIDFYKSIFI